MFHFYHLQHLDNNVKKGIFKLGLWLKVDASRRQNDPRKLGKDSNEHGAV